MLRKLPLLVLTSLIGVIFASAILTFIFNNARPQGPAIRSHDLKGVEAVNPKIGAEMTKLALAKNRTAKNLLAAIKTVKSELKAGRISTGSDFYCAAMILSNGDQLEDALLTHDFAICAMALGERRAKALSALSIDQFLIRTGKKQRFGTQFQGGQLLVAPEVTDAMRLIVGVPSVLASRARLARDASYKPVQLDWQQYAMRRSPKPLD